MNCDKIAKKKNGMLKRKCIHLQNVEDTKIKFKQNDKMFRMTRFELYIYITFK